jgi:alpha-L-rhamnosidase
VKKAAEIRDAFNKEFYNPATGQYATGSQCSNAVPLVMGLVEPANRQAVLDAIVQDVTERGNALTAGDVGYRYLLRALAEGGRSDVIYAMNNQSEKPGYGYQLKMGATSLTEAWNARRSSSQNHFMLGQIIEWFYRDLAGICPDPMDPGFKKIIIKPQPVSDLSYVKASFNSIHGEIVSDWEHTNDSFILRVTIPAEYDGDCLHSGGTGCKNQRKRHPGGKKPRCKVLTT